jgi:hypothetical protein
MDWADAMSEQLSLLQVQEKPADNSIERKRVWYVIQDGEWRTIYEVQRRIEQRFGKHYSDSSVSARIRDFRKMQFGGHIIERRSLGDSTRTFEYRLVRP